MTTVQTPPTGILILALLDPDGVVVGAAAVVVTT
jgi:hypothetical protein